jgi:hypothetical protein
MKTSTDLELLSNQKIEMKSVFKDDRENEEFNREFLLLIQEWLKTTAKAREQSQEEAMRRWRRMCTI